MTEADVFQNEMFRKLHLKYFPNHIANMTYEQAIYAINFRPSCFALLKPDSNLRASFKQNPNILVTIIKNSPLVIKYLTRDEIYSIPDEKILEYLPTDFFKKHNPKYVFQTIKHKLKSSILSYYQQQIDSGRTDIQPMDAINRFPELATYFSSSQMVANPKKSVKKSKEIVVQKNDEFEDEFDF